MFNKLKNKAVTLTEILVAVVMLAVAGLPIFGLMNFSSRGTREQSAEAEAGNLAKEEMNRLMYVANYDDLLDNTNPNNVKLNVACQFAENKTEVVRKGNIFKGTYSIYPHKNEDVKFKIPKLKFHKPQLCSAGGESQSSVVDLTQPEELSLKDLYPDVETPLLIDIYLEIQWKLPADKNFPEKNKLILYGRRYHTVE
ncbi:MAG: type II secretion system protein [Candidatus Riflebacteria bacterium]|jgi:type II secretory pathway pseudopilin PulG|nr:type II secretion system protein [Candidatus Riflebacteria bacterium]